MKKLSYVKIFEGEFSVWEGDPVRSTDQWQSPSTCKNSKQAEFGWQKSQKSDIEPPNVPSESLRMGSGKPLPPIGVEKDEKNN
ncbi:hypothetical protein HOLleu_27341 [Holothuria leucospilota]|uniref:Uncharacterized protein n=1 Tax=Holothuria leucospilota TaxID=206669 RepID=A0A9Q1BQL5_HOLLE|nr:hypothetical protein HOLleu_27341 [Holothuria leucospilota]